MPFDLLFNKYSTDLFKLKGNKFYHTRGKHTRALITSSGRDSGPRETLVECFGNDKSLKKVLMIIVTKSWITFANQRRVIVNIVFLITLYKKHVTHM